MTRLHHRLVKNAKFLSCLSALFFILLSQATGTSHTYAASRIAVPVPVSTTSSNWSGYEATAQVNTFKKVQCQAQVPTLNSRGDVSAWCGLGGDPSFVPGGPANTVLVQAGLDSCLGPSCINGNSNAQSNFAWWEIADALIVQPVQFSQGVHSGDNLYFYMESGLNNNVEDKFYIRNITTNESHTIIVNSQGATKDGQSISLSTISGNTRVTSNIPIVSDGASVECIVERPLDAITNTLINLPSFGSEKIGGCDTGLEQSRLLQPMGIIPTISKITMFNRGGSNAPAALLTNVTRFSGLFDTFNVANTSALDVSRQQVRNSVLQHDASSDHPTKFKQT
jgi:hypothetical protein